MRIYLTRKCHLGETTTTFYSVLLRMDIVMVAVDKFVKTEIDFFTNYLIEQNKLTGLKTYLNEIMKTIDTKTYVLHIRNYYYTCLLSNPCATR